MRGIETLFLEKPAAGAPDVGQTRPQHFGNAAFDTATPTQSAHADQKTASSGGFVMVSS
jgi:hypothetical protein